MKREKSRKYSRAFFAFALFCFVLPFVTIACPGGQVSLSGYELVLGTEIDEEDVGGEPVAVLAFVATLAGLAFSFTKTDRAFLSAGISGGFGVLFLWILRSRISKEVVEATGGLAVVSYQMGYWLALLALIAGTGSCLYARSHLGKKDVSNPPRAPVPPPLPPPAE